MRKKYLCSCRLCDPNIARKIKERENEKFERKMIVEEIQPPEENIFDSWYDWELHYDSE